MDTISAGSRQAAMQGSPEGPWSTAVPAIAKPRDVRTKYAASSSPGRPGWDRTASSRGDQLHAAFEVLFTPQLWEIEAAKGSRESGGSEAEQSRDSRADRTGRQVPAG